jgi:hypothetical protein
MATDQISALARFLTAMQKSRPKRAWRKWKPRHKPASVSLDTTPEKIAVADADNFPLDALLAAFVLREAASLLSDPNLAARLEAMAQHIEKNEKDVCFMNLVAAACLVGFQMRKKKRGR